MIAQLIIFLPLLYLLLQWSALSKMRDGWLVAARLPLVILAVALIALVVGIAIRVDLAVVAIVLVLPAMTLYLLMLWPIYLLVRGVR